MELKFLYVPIGGRLNLLLIAPLMELKCVYEEHSIQQEFPFNRTAYGIEIYT